MLNIVCALQCEARPFIDRLKLKADQGCALFSLYRSETTQLIISGSSEHIEPEDVAEAVSMVLNLRKETVFDEINLSPQKKKIVWSK